MAFHSVNIQPISSLLPAPSSSICFPPPQSLCSSVPVSSFKYGEDDMYQRVATHFAQSLHSISLRYFFCHMLSPACCCKDCSELVQNCQQGVAILNPILEQLIYMLQIQIQFCASTLRIMMYKWQGGEPRDGWSPEVTLPRTRLHSPVTVSLTELSGL